MISRTSLSSVLNSYQNDMIDSKGKNKVTQKQKPLVEKSKVEQIKESIENGSYKFDLDATASKVLESLI